MSPLRVVLLTLIVLLSGCAAPVDWRGTYHQLDGNWDEPSEQGIVLHLEEQSETTVTGRLVVGAREVAVELALQDEDLHQHLLDIEPPLVIPGHVFDGSPPKTTTEILMAAKDPPKISGSRTHEGSSYITCYRARREQRTYIRFILGGNEFSQLLLLAEDDERLGASR